MTFSIVHVRCATHPVLMLAVVCLHSAASGAVPQMESFEFMTVGKSYDCHFSFDKLLFSTPSTGKLQFDPGIYYKNKLKRSGYVLETYLTTVL